MKTYYKVVRRKINGDGTIILSSVVIPGYNGGVHYKIGEWTRPILLDSRLFIFDSYELARLWSMCGTSIIFKCHAVGIEKPKLMGSYGLKSMKRFWKQRKNKKSLNSTKQVPIGTLYCKKVKLLTEIKQEDLHQS